MSSPLPLSKLPSFTLPRDLQITSPALFSTCKNSFLTKLTGELGRLEAAASTASTLARLPRLQNSFLDLDCDLSFFFRNTTFSARAANALPGPILTRPRSDLSLTQGFKVC
jgi:hypothetical protein